MANYRKELNVIFINLSNHPSSKWDNSQIKAAKEFGEIVDIPFPAVNPTATEEDVEELAKEYVQRIIEFGDSTVMVQGEFTFTYRVVNKLKEYGITVVSSCSERQSVETVREDGSIHKESIFRFVSFRKY